MEKKWKKSGKKVEKLKCEIFFTFVKFHIYVITDDFGGKNEKKW